MSADTSVMDIHVNPGTLILLQKAQIVDLPNSIAEEI